MFNFCKTMRQLDWEDLPKNVQVLKFQKVFSRKLSPFIMSKIHGNCESLSWDFLRLNYLKSDLGKIKFRLRQNKKLFEKMFWIDQK